MQNIIKIVNFYTLDAPEELKTQEFSFHKDTFAISKKIFDQLNDGNLFEIADMQTKKRVTIVYFTTNANPEKEQTSVFDSNYFNSHKILTYLTENYDLEFINKFETEFQIE